MMFRKLAVFFVLTIGMIVFPCLPATSLALGQEATALLIGVDSQDMPCSGEIEYLQKTLLECGFSQKGISVLTSKSSTKPTLENLKQEFNRLASLHEEDLLFVAFMGPCCSINQELYFAPEGADESRSSLMLLKENIEKLQTRRLVLLVDATCTPTGTAREPISVKNVRPEHFPENAVLFFNDLDDYENQTRPEKSLVRYFAEQLQESDHNADLNDDKKVDVTELLRLFEIHPDRLYFKGFRKGNQFENFIFAQQTAKPLGDFQGNSKIPEAKPPEKPSVLPSSSSPPLVSPRNGTGLYEEVAQTKDSDFSVVSLVFDEHLGQEPLLWGASGFSLRVYQVSDLKQVGIKRFQDQITSIALRPLEREAESSEKDNHLLVATEDMKVELFKARYNREERSFAADSIRVYDHMEKLHPDEPGTIQVLFDSTSERFLAASSLQACLWDDSGENSSYQIVDSRLRSAVLDTAAVCFIPKKNQLLAAFVGSPISLRNLEVEPQYPNGGKVLREYHHFGVIYGLALSPDGNIFVSISSNDKAVVWDLDSSSSKRQFDEHKDDITTVAFSPDGFHVLTASLDGTTLLWNVETGKVVQSFAELAILEEETKQKNNYVSSVAFSPDAKHIAFGLSDGKIVLYRKATDK